MERHITIKDNGCPEGYSEIFYGILYRDKKDIVLLSKQKPIYEFVNGFDGAEISVLKKSGSLYRAFRKIKYNVDHLKKEREDRI